MSFTVAIASRTNTPFDTSGLTIEPSEAWTAQALGGFDTATLNVSGTKDAIRRLAGWLLFRVQIIDDRGVVCWEGYVDSLDMRLGGSTVTMSTEWLYNSVRVLYSYSSPDGGSESTMTDWLYRTPHAFPNKKLFRLGLACNYGIDEAGVRVAKHGNRAASSACGSADVLEALGLPHTQVTRVTLDIKAQEVPLLTVTRVIDLEDVQALKEVVERYRITGTAEPQP